MFVPFFLDMDHKCSYIVTCMEALNPGTTVVALLPVRSDRAAFHECILGGKAEMRFIRGRLAFELGGHPILDSRGYVQKAPFPSMLAIWRGDSV